jgi:hypothetical protein
MKNKQVFWRSFFHAMATPALLYGNFSSPVIAHAEPIKTPTKDRSDLQAMRGDWVKIGGDFAVAMNKHGQAK